MTDLMTRPRLELDFEEAKRFLSLLDPNTDTFTFQAFRQTGGYAWIETGRLIDLWDKIQHSNQQGAGIAVTVNPTKEGGRNGEVVTSVRAVWHDDDTGYSGTFPLSPSIMVETSSDRFHRYWKVADLWPADAQGRDDFKRVMYGLVRDYACDKQATDIARCLRLPGTYNHKPDKPFLVRMTGPAADEPMLWQSRSDIVSAFAVEPEPHVSSANGMASSADLKRAALAIMSIPADNHDEWKSVGMALHHATGGSEEGFTIWDDWSRTTVRGNYNANQTRYQWAAFKDVGNPKTLATVFWLAGNFGWKDETGSELPTRFSDRPTKRFGKLYPEPTELSERTLAEVRKRFNGYGDQEPSEDEYDGLMQIAYCIESMAGNALGNMIDAEGDRIGLAPKYIVSSMATGTGKTTVVIEAVRLMGEMEKYQDLGVIILLSRLEEIKRYVEKMKLSDDDFAVIVSDGKPENSLGRQDDKTKARVLFTTQEGLRVRGQDGASYAEMDRLFFNGKPRPIRIWDEALLPSRTLTIGAFDISDMFKTLAEWEQGELVAELVAFFDRLKDVSDHAIVTVPDIGRYEISIEDARTWFSDDRQDAVEALFKLSGNRVKVRQDHRGNVMLDYIDLLPPDLAPMLVLDASGQFRQTYWFWHESRKGLEFLPSPIKRYDGLTIHHWDRGAGRKAQHLDHQSIALGVAKTIDDIPEGEPVLVVHFLPGRYIPDMKAEISKLLNTPRDVHYLNWGRHTATNDYHEIKHVVLAGILQYSVPENEAFGRGAKGLKVDDELTEADFDGTRLGEIAHNINQAANRAYFRHTINGCCPPDCHLYIIFSTAKRTGVPREILDWVFPGAEVTDWKPVYALRGQKKALADLLMTIDGEITKAEVMERIGIRGGKTENLNRHLKDDDVIGYLDGEGIAFDYDKKSITVRATQEPLKAIHRADSSSTRKVEDDVEGPEWPF